MCDESLVDENGEINDKVSVELMRCAEDINMLDEKMINLFQK